MRPRAWIGAVLVASVAFAQEPSETHPPAGVTRHDESGGSLYEASVPGRLLDWAALTAAESRRIYLLASVEEDNEGLRTLYRVDLESEALHIVLDRLDTRFDRLLALDLQGDGREELLLGRPGAIVLVTALESDGPELSPLVEAPGVDLASELPARGRTQPSSRIALSSVGLLRRFESRDGTWAPVGSESLPTRAAPHRHGLRLTTPRSTLLALEDGDVYAVGPESIGSLRLRSTLLTPGDQPTERVVWSRLPGPETVQWSWFHTIDGRPFLIVTTNSADKLGIFERQQLRVFPLVGDRTQAGVGPWVAARTTSRRWQRVEPFVVDIERDGDEDLVMAQFDGLGSGKVKVEAFVNNGKRRFETRTRSTVIDAEASGWHFGADLTGDGLADLVLLAEGDLRVYPGLAAGKTRLVDKQALWSFAGADIPRAEGSVEIGDEGVAVTDDRSDASGRPVLLDVDGDGREELLLAENPRWGFGRLRIVVLPPR